MGDSRKRLVFFERWLDGVAEEVLGAEEDIELVRLRYADPEVDNWAALASACGYHVSSRNELREPWFGTSELLSRCPRLLALCSTGAGFDVIDVDACTEAGVVVCNQSGTNSEPVAEHAVGLMLSLTKRIGAAHRAVLRGDVHDRFRLMGSDIRGKTVGIVGIGHIVRRVARYCQAFDMRVLACDPYLDAGEVAARGAEKVDLATLLQRADFVTVHCPRSEETEGMFGAAEFARMQPGAFFINTARGRIHDEGALLDALERGAIAGAGLDVFDVEPPPADHPLLRRDDVVATPHIAGATHEAVHEMCRASAEQWIALLRGQVPPRLVNPEAWPLYSDRFEAIAGVRPEPLPARTATRP
jgi:D-3-phosphoglycerate dehydrogenase / 2-oxoglutarate reductase